FELSVLGLELKRVAHSAVIPGPFPIAKRGQPALLEQWPQFVRLVERALCTDNFEAGFVFEDQSHQFAWNKGSCARKGRSHSVDCQPQSLEWCLSCLTHGFASACRPDGVAISAPV